MLAESRIRHAGEPIALVLTESRSALAAALDAITFDWEPLPAVFDVEAALAPGAPLLHDGMPEGNLVRLVTVDKGEGQAGFQACDAVVEAVFDVPSQEHAYLETEAGFAAIDERGRLVITASTQTPFRDRLEIAPVLGLDPESIRVIAPFLGGGFGGKDGITVQALLGLAVLHSGGRPVKMWWDREESFLAGVKRMAARMYYRLGAKRTGELHALSCRLYYDSGAYAGLCGEIMTLGVEHAGSAYRIPHVHIEGRCVSTNNTPGGPFRGFGVPQVTAAMEQMIDLLARRLSTDPLTIRERNGLRQGDSNCVGLTLPYSTGVLDCLAAVRKHPLWQGREAWKGRAGMFRKRGVGLACMAHAMGYPPIVPDVGLARIGLTEEGRVRVFAGVADMGQGNASTCLQIAGVILNQPAGAMDLVLPDTDKTLPSGSASASRCTFVYGNALVGAATELKRRVLEKARTLAGATSGDGLELLAGKVREKATDNDIPLADIARLMDAERAGLRRALPGADCARKARSYLHGASCALLLRRPPDLRGGRYTDRKRGSERVPRGDGCGDGAKPPALRAANPGGSGARPRVRALRDVQDTERRGRNAEPEHVRDPYRTRYTGYYLRSRRAG